MCENCFEEYYGAPTEITDNAVKAAALIRQVYQFAPTGGRCHIVVDDWNLSDSCVRFCVDEVAKDEANGVKDQQIIAERALLDLLVTMPERERAVGLALYDGFVRLN